MAISKSPQKAGYVEGVGKRSKKRSGELSTSIRIPIGENKKYHRAAKAENRSFNSWALTTLSREADRILAALNNKIPGDGPTARAMRAASRGTTK